MDIWRRKIVSPLSLLSTDVLMNLGIKDYEWVISLNRTLLKLLGIWPESEESASTILTTNIRVIVIFNVIIIICVIPTFLSLIRIWGDITSMIDNLQHTLPLLIALMKFFLLWRNKPVLASAVQMVKTDWLKLKTKAERVVMIKRAQNTRIVIIWGCFVMLISLILVVIFPAFGLSIRYVTNITDPGRVMLLQTYYLYDVSNSPLYEVIFLLQGFSLLIAGAMYTTTDTFMSLLVFHVCGQLENLKARIINLTKFNNFAAALSSSVEDHIRLIKFVKIINNTFSLMLLGLLVYFGILFALYGFLFVTVMTQGRNLSVTRLIFLLMAFSNLFAHMCLYCAVGEFLVMQCDGIYEAACQCEWYKLQPNQGKSCLLIIIRAKYPLYLTAGKVFPMTMATLCNLLKSSAGYISVLLAHRN